LPRKKKIAAASAKRAEIIKKLLYITDISLAIWITLTDMRKPDSAMNLKSFLVSSCVIKKRPEDSYKSAGIENKDSEKSEVK
jgi:hypothetical protein